MSHIQDFPLRILYFPLLLSNFASHVTKTIHSNRNPGFPSPGDDQERIHFLYHPEGIPEIRIRSD